MKKLSNRMLALAMSLCMIFTMMPMAAHATTHEHDDTCGYSAASECTHTHDSTCGYAEAIAGSDCTHSCTDGTCSYVAASNGTPCGHSHDASCGYAEARPCSFTPCDHSTCGYVAESPCSRASCNHSSCGYDENNPDSYCPNLGCDHQPQDNCGYVEGVECLNAGQTCDHSTCGYTEGSPCNHTEHTDCGYSAPVEGIACNHSHNANCGYVEVVDAQPCTHAHDATCGYSVGSDCTYVEPVAETTTYTITYTDGVESEEIFADVVYYVAENETVPTYVPPERDGYIFDGWNPNYTPTVTADTIFTAKWREHISDGYTVTYTDGVDSEEIFSDMVYEDLSSGDETPAYEGTPTRTGYTFAGWSPEVAATVTGNATYTAQWTENAPAHTHDYSVKYNATHHWEECSCGDKQNENEHSFSDATCIMPGMCMCGAETAIDSTNHSGGTAIHNAKDATETEDGYTGDTYCIDCGNKLADGETIPATGGEDDDDTHTHNYRNEHDDTHHWKKCSSCGDISDKGEHTPGVAATCRSLAECADCKMPYGDLDITNHKYLSYVEYEAGHRLLCVCGRLDDVAEMEPHIYTNDKDRSCNICGYEREIHAHRYTLSTCTTAGVCSCGATTGVNPNNHTGGTEIRNAAEATIVAEGYTGDTYCLGCGSMIASGEVIPKAGVIFDGPGVEDVTFIPAAGTELPEDAVVIVEDHTPSADDLAFLALPETTDPSVRYAVVPEDWIGSMDAAVIGPDGGRYIRHEKLLINGKEYYVSGGDDGESLSLYDKEGNIYSYDGEEDPQVIGQDAGTEYPENEFIDINGAIYQVHSVLRDTDGTETLILYLDGKPAGMFQFNQFKEIDSINIYNDDYHPAKVKARQQLTGYVGTVTTGDNPIDGLESGKTYNVSVIGSNDISVSGAENVNGTVTQTFAVPDALIGNKNVVYTAVHKTASGNEIGEVTLSEDGKTLTATYTVSSFSPFTVYAFVEADEPEIKTLSATIVDGSDDTTEAPDTDEPVVSPQTNDNTIWFILIAVVAGAIAVASVVYGKRRKSKVN